VPVLRGDSHEAIPTALGTLDSHVFFCDSRKRVKNPTDKFRKSISIEPESSQNHDSEARRRPLLSGTRAVTVLVKTAGGCADEASLSDAA
jgi:hypothetical protein